MISMMQKGIFATAVISLLALAHNASAQNVYYRWMDDRGNPVHSDRPPPQGVDYEVVKTGSSTVREVPATAGAVPAETSPRVNPITRKVANSRLRSESATRALL